MDLFFFNVTSSKITKNGIDNVVFVSLRISLLKQCIDNCAYLIYKWGPWVCSIFKQSNLKTSAVRVNPDTASRQKPESCLSRPYYFLPCRFSCENSSPDITWLSWALCSAFTQLSAASNSAGAWWWTQNWGRWVMKLLGCISQRCIRFRLRVGFSIRLPTIC